MTAMTEPPAERFQLSMLLYDRRYRSMTIQIVALIGFPYVWINEKSKPLS